MQEEVLVETKEEVLVETAENNEVETKQPESKKTADKSAVSVLPYFTEARVTCACGNKFTTGSTKEEIRVEICNSCHPFFTGQEKFVDTEGRVERFKRLEDSKKESKAKKETEKKSDPPKTLKEMLMSLSDK